MATAMTSQFVTVRDSELFVELVLNRPPLNILNIAMMREMNSALTQLQRHPRARVLLLRAQGKAFSAGVDVAEHTADHIEEMMGEFHRMFALIETFTIPTVAAVDGAALGGGCELATYCDLVLASERSLFGQPEIKVGVFPPVAAVILPRLVGRNRALELLMHGEAISAKEAERIGLITKVLPVEGFEEQVDAYVAKMTSQSRVILEMTKRAVDGGLHRPCAEALGMTENIYMNEMMKTHDAQEGLNAFLEKRRPVWKDR